MSAFGGKGEDNTRTSVQRYRVSRRRERSEQTRQSVRKPRQYKATSEVSSGDLKVLYSPPKTPRMPLLARAGGRVITRQDSVYADVIQRCGDSKEHVGSGSGSGIVEFKAPPDATPAQIAQVKAYVDGCNKALNAGKLSSTGRVSTQGSLRRQASRAARKEAQRAARAGTPYTGHVGHVPDTTWTGTPEPYDWLDLDPVVNTSLGGQSNGYSEGYKPTGFVFKEDN